MKIGKAIATTASTLGLAGMAVGGFGAGANWNEARHLGEQLEELDNTYAIGEGAVESLEADREATVDALKETQSRQRMLFAAEALSILMITSGHGFIRYQSEREIQAAREESRRLRIGRILEGQQLTTTTADLSQLRSEIWSAGREQQNAISAAYAVERLTQIIDESTAAPATQEK